MRHDAAPLGMDMHRSSRNVARRARCVVAQGAEGGGLNQPGTDRARAFSRVASIDWSTLLGDIAYLLGEPHRTNAALRVAVGTPALSAHLGMSRGAVRNLLELGSEPRHSEGVRLLQAWASLTGKMPSDAPLARPSLSAATARRMA